MFELSSDIVDYLLQEEIGGAVKGRLQSGVFQVLTRSDVREILVLNRESEGHIPAWPSDDTVLYSTVLVHPE